MPDRFFAAIISACPNSYVLKRSTLLSCRANNPFPAIKTTCNKPLCFPAMCIVAQIALFSSHLHIEIAVDDF
jgi:hypothetical protein